MSRIKSRIRNIVIVISASFAGLFLCCEIKAKSSQEATDEVMAEISRLERRNEINTAIDIILKHLIKNGSDPVASGKLSDLLLQRGDFLKAYKIATIVRRHYPDYDWPYILQFKSALELKKYSAAKKIMKKLDEIESTVNRPQLWGDFHRMKGDLLKADDFYESALKLDPKSKSLRRLKIWNLKNAISQLIEEENFVQARVGVTRLLACTKGKSHLEALEISGDLKLKVNSLDGAEKDYSEAVQLGGDGAVKEKLADIRVRLANVALAAGNKEMTEKWLNAVDVLGPNFHSFFLRANIHRDEGRYEKAEDFYLKAESLNNLDPNLYEAMGWNYSLWSRLQDAEQAISKAIALKPDDARYRVIRANQLKNARQLSMALGELIAGRKLCDISKDCSRFDGVYDEHFFENTDAEGLSLDFIGLPMTVTSMLGYREERSDLVGVSRGLAAQDVPANSYSMFLSPSKSPILEGRLHFGYYKADRPFVSGYYSQIQKYGPQRDRDPSIPLKSQVAAIETEGSFPLPFLGVVSFFPYLKFIGTEAHAFDTYRVSGDKVDSREFVLGARGLWLFRWYLPALEGEVSGGRLIESDNANFHTLRARLGIQQNFTKYFKFQLDGSLYNRNLSSELIQSQTQGSVLLHVSPYDWIHVTGGYSLLTTDDKKTLSQTKTDERRRTHHRQSTIGLAITPSRSFKFDSSFYKTIVQPYRVYDHKSMTNQLEFAIWPKLSREIGARNRLYYLAPIRLIMGHDVQFFNAPNELRADIDFMKETRLSSYFISAKLFW